LPSIDSIIAAQMYARVRRQPRPLGLGDLLGQQEPHLGIFVADVEIGLGRFHHPGRDQHAFDEAMRIKLEIVAILEGAGLALVAIDREQPRRGLRAHQRPFAPSRETGTPETAKPGVAHDLDQVIARARAGKAGPEQGIAALALIALEILRGGIGMRMGVLGRRSRHLIGRGPHHLTMADRADRSPVTGAHARRTHDPYAGAEPGRKIAQERLGACHCAGQRIAHPHRDGRRRGLALLHHVEVGIEGRDLVDLGQREPHLLRQRSEMRGRKMAVAVLDQVQMLNQQVALARALTEQRPHLLERTGIDLAALGGPARTAGTTIGAIGAVRPAIRKRCGIHWKASRAHIGVALIPHNPLVLISRLKFSIVSII
jgi:hypothetical protein